MRIIMFESAFSFASSLWTNFHAWHSVSQVNHAMIAISVLSALLITRITGSTGLITIPASFVILYVTAMVSNFGGSSIAMTEIGVFQKAVFFSVMGHFIGGIIILGIFKVADR
jgi:hypothetical protein